MKFWAMNPDSFGLIEVSTGKRTENVCNDALCTLMQFSFLFWLMSWSTKKIQDSFLNTWMQT